MKLLSPFVLGLSAVLVSFAIAQELPEGVTQTMVDQGKTVFAGEGICFSCHGPEGKGTMLAPDLTDGEWIHVDGSFDSLVQLIQAGVPKPTIHPGPMPPKGGSAIDDEKVRAVAAYIWTLSHTGS